MGCTICTKLNPETQTKKLGVITNKEEIKIDQSNFIVQNENVFHDIYRLGPVLSKSSLGEIRNCYNRETGLKLAVKIFRKDLTTNVQQRVKQEKEIQMLKKLDHPNIIKILEYFEDISKTYLVMECCQGQSLQVELKQKKVFSEQETARIMRQLISSVYYMHQAYIVHRNINLQNIIFQQRSDTSEIKIINFASASFCGSKQYIPLHEESIYTAPEATQTHYPRKSDLWSCGIVMLMLLKGNLHFQGLSSTQVLNLVSYSNFLDQECQGVSELALNFLKQLLQPEVTRIHSKQALDHEWILTASNNVPSQNEIQSAMSNLQESPSDNTLKSAVETFIVTQCLTMKQSKELRDIFRQIDLNGDGKISKEELLQGYSMIHQDVNQKDIERIMQTADTNNSGYIDYTEFIKATFNSKTLLSRQNLKTAFKKFDIDRDGVISAEELRVILKGDSTISDSVWLEIVSEVDQNGDGRIDLQEFQNLLLKKLDN